MPTLGATRLLFGSASHPRSTRRRSTHSTTRIHHPRVSTSSLPDHHTMSSGWVGPGARSSPQNKFENDNYQATKHRLEAEEKEKRDIENARRVSMGEKPLKDSLWTKVKRVFKRSMM